MPEDANDYARIQILHKHASQSFQCPTGCISASAERQQETSSTRRYASEKNLLETVASERDRFSADHFDHDRFDPSEHFGAEHNCSERISSGDRYQGVSERFPLGERPQTSVSTDKLLPKEVPQNSEQCTNERTVYNPERYNFERTKCPRYPIQNLGSLERYHVHNTLERNSKPTVSSERYHTLSSDKDRNRSNDRYTSIEKYQSSPMEMFNGNANDRHASTQSICSIERYTPTERHRSGSKTDVHQSKCGSSNTESKEKERIKKDHYHTRYDHFNNDRYDDRFPTIPCPERFSAQDRSDRSEKLPYSQVPYLEPPSPAPVNDIFIHPPPLSPENMSSPDCFPNNTFPSPTNTIPISDRFIPPPPLSPSPTNISTTSPKKFEQYDKMHMYHHNDQNFRERYSNYTNKYQQNGGQHQKFNSDKYVNNENRFNNGDIYLPPNAHTPVERYIPQSQEPYYTCYDSNGYKQLNSNDPYMRRDLGYHYRLSIPYNTTNQYQRVRYPTICAPTKLKCCQYQEGYQLSKSSPSSSSNSSMTSQGKDLYQKDVQCVNNSLQEIQCQNYQGKEVHCSYQQKNCSQCGNLQCHQNKECLGFLSPNLSLFRGHCRHSICVSPSVEYVGASGGRLVCATPPPKENLTEGSICSEKCCSRRTHGSLTVVVWQSTPQITPGQHAQQHQQQKHHTTQTNDDPIIPQTVSHRLATSVIPPEQEMIKSEAEEQVCETPTKSLNTQTFESSTQSPMFMSRTNQRAASMPAGSTPERQPTSVQKPLGYSQSERLPNRPPYTRSVSRKELIKNYIKKETATFFGVNELNEQEQQLRWLDRRKRMACRTMGPLKDEHRQSSNRHSRHQQVLPELSTMQQRSGRLQTERPDILPSDVTDVGTSSTPEELRLKPGEVNLRRKDSVARMTWDGMSYVIAILTQHRSRRRSQQSTSRSFCPETPSIPSTPEYQTFFEKIHSAKTLEDEDTTDKGLLETEAGLQDKDLHMSSNTWKREREFGEVQLRNNQSGPLIGRNRILSTSLDGTLDNSNRKQYGMGWVGRLLGQTIRKSVGENLKIQSQLNDMEDHRPMFTYWITTVQILVLFISIFCYGFGPFGIDFLSRSSQVLVTSLSLQQVDYMEPANFWFGPRPGDLIHLGAKFAPCMRIDNKIKKEIDKIHSKERETACCIRNDDSGCVQSSQADCSLRRLRPSKTISTWKKWTTGESGPGGRISGSVCGLDPKFCDAPASVHPYEWPDDITKWPICRKMNTQFSIQKNGPRDKLAEHMVCEIIGHPCCIGIHGQCKITTKEFCDFVRGTFHEEASLCSQVSCLNDVCGMIPFYFSDVPDQFYRLWTSLFLHAGILQLMITVLIQYFLMRELEKLTGSLRIGIIYIGSGVAGNLASAIFVPYRADVGPAGSQFGLLACLIVEVLNAWPMLKYPHHALCKLLSITLVLFLIGLLPWVDNYAHVFGFIFGFLLSYALLPFISFGHYDRHKKIFLIWVCLTAAWIVFICLVLLFYIIPVYDCKICSYFNCIPLTRDFCASQNINFKREEPIV